MFETTLSIEPKVIALADKAIATVRIVGTVPLRVAVPPAILDDPTSLSWNISPLGNATESRDGASFVWQQQYQLSPFIVGNALPVQFSSFQVNNSTVAVPAAQVSVNTSIQSLTAADVRPVTPPELSPATATDPSTAMVFLGVVMGLGLLLCIVGTLLWLRRKTVVEVPSPLERLRVDLETWPLEPSKTSAQELARRIRDVLPEPTSKDERERFARLDRWMYSAEVPTAVELQAEVEYWRGSFEKRHADQHESSELK
jgi:hypothetical protein